MDQQQLDEWLQSESNLSTEQIIDLLSYIDERISMNDSMLMGLSQARLMTNFHAFAQISLNLLNDGPKNDINQWVKEACYGIDSISRRELQSD